MATNATVLLSIGKFHQSQDRQTSFHAELFPQPFLSQFCVLFADPMTSVWIDAILLGNFEAVVHRKDSCRWAYIILQTDSNEDGTFDSIY